MIYCAHKPTGITSHDLVMQYRRLRGTRKVWHCGTLDPLATGLMILCSDEHTRYVAHLTWHDKSYCATIDLSHISDTRDTQYRSVYQHIDCTIPTREQITDALDMIQNQSQLRVPPFSSKKLNGKKLYEYARAGEMVEMMSAMHISGYHVLSYDFPYIEISFDVTSGTYIRSIAYTLWEILHTWGILTQLERTRIGTRDTIGDITLEVVSDFVIT